MILEGTFEQRIVGEYRRLKEKENSCMENIKKATENNEAAWKSKDDALIQKSWEEIDQALEAHKAVKKELGQYARSIANLALDALEQNRCVDESGRSI